MLCSFKQYLSLLMFWSDSDITCYKCIVVYLLINKFLDIAKSNVCMYVFKCVVIG